MTASEDVWRKANNSCWIRLDSPDVLNEYSWIYWEAHPVKDLYFPLSWLRSDHSLTLRQWNFNSAALKHESTRDVSLIGSVSKSELDVDITDSDKLLEQNKSNNKMWCRLGEDCASQVWMSPGDKRKKKTKPIVVLFRIKVYCVWWPGFSFIDVSLHSMCQSAFAGAADGADAAAVGPKDKVRRLLRGIYSF